MSLHWLGSDSDLTFRGAGFRGVQPAVGAFADSLFTRLIQRFHKDEHLSGGADGLIGIAWRGALLWQNLARQCLQLAIGCEQGGRFPTRDG